MSAPEQPEPPLDAAERIARMVRQAQLAGDPQVRAEVAMALAVAPAMKAAAKREREGSE